MSSGVWIVVAIAAALVAVIAVYVSRNRSTHNSVDSFRRQIDALGPAARRTVVDQVQQTAATRDDEVVPPDDEATDPADEDGPRGT